MPIVIFTGGPCSGKTTRATQFSTYLSENCNLPVKIISDDDFGIDKNDIYSGKYRNSVSTLRLRPCQALAVARFAGLAAYTPRPCGLYSRAWLGCTTEVNADHRSQEFGDVNREQEFL